MITNNWNVTTIEKTDGLIKNLTRGKEGGERAV